MTEERISLVKARKEGLVGALEGVSRGMFSGIVQGFAYPTLSRINNKWTREDLEQGYASAKPEHPSLDMIYIGIRDRASGFAADWTQLLVKYGIIAALVYDVVSGGDVTPNAITAGINFPSFGLFGAATNTLSGGYEIGRAVTKNSLEKKVQSAQPAEVTSASAHSGA